jgi:hypothetical protein
VNDRCTKAVRLGDFLVGLMRDPEVWPVLDDALHEPLTIDFTHRGSTVRITIGPK